MTSKAHMLLLTLMLCFMNLGHAETSKTIRFENQREESFDLENFLKETRYKTETVDSTCYRQEPYVQNVCRDVTRYRQECSTIPAHQECRTVWDNVCRTENRYENECHMEQGPQECRVVVRYRQECSTQGGGQQCRTEPGRVDCRIVNGENRCEKIPPRQVCENRPGQQVCRQVPYEERECHAGPSRQVCQQVNRPHQVCQQVSRQQCDWIPAQNVCNQVPYTVKECKDETLYRQIPYACKKDVQVPYEVTLKTYQADVQVLFDTKSSGVVTDFLFDLSTKGDLTLAAKEVAGNNAVVFAKKDIKTEAQGDVNSTKATYKIALYNKDDIFSVNEKGISNIDLSKTELTFVVNGKFDQARSSLYTKIMKKDDLKFEKTLKPSQFTAKYDGKVTRVTIDLEALGTKLSGGFLGLSKTHTVTLKLKVDYSDVGEVLLPKGEISTGTTVDVKVD